MALAGLLGAINGAATRYSTRLEQAAENNASLTERMIEGRGLVTDAKRNKDTLYYMSPMMQVLSGGNNYGYNPDEPETFMMAVNNAQNLEFQRGRLNFSITKTDDPIRNVDALLNADIGFQYSQFRDRDDELGEDIRRWEAATISSLAGLADENKVKGEGGADIALQPIHNQIPGWDNFPPDRKAYYNELIRKAFNYKKDAAEFVGLIDKTGTPQNTPSFNLTEDDTLEFVPQSFPNVDGTKTSIEDIPQEIITSLVSVGQTRPLDEIQVYTRKTMNTIHSMNQAKSLPHAEGVATVQFLNNQFTSGNIEQSGGVFYSIPANRDLIKQNTSKIYKTVGMGNFIALTAAAMPDSALYNEGPIPPGGITAFKKDRREKYQEKVLGIEGSDKRAKFNSKTADLRSLTSNISSFLQVLELGAEVGAGGEFLLFLNGAKAFFNSMQSIFGKDAEYLALFGGDNESLGGIFNSGVSRFDEKGRATQIAKFLEKQLAYSVARALESSTGNARLSNIDVAMAQSSLGLSNLLANKNNATAVLTLLLRRTERELEYQEALGSNDLRTMQAAGYALSLYGTDSMLRITNADNQSTAYNELRSSLEAEAEAQGLTITERGKSNTGRMD